MVCASSLCSEVHVIVIVFFFFFFFFEFLSKGVRSAEGSPMWPNSVL